MAKRRTLTYSSFDEVMPDVERLLAGHTTVGKWSLGQICNHLRWAIEGSIEGTSEKAPWLLRKFVGSIVMRRIIKKGVIAEGIQTPESFQPKPGLDAHAEAESLREAIQRFASHIGTLAEHPFGGPLTRDEWERLHRIHLAHHLSFALPA